MPVQRIVWAATNELATITNEQHVAVAAVARRWERLTSLTEIPIHPGPDCIMIQVTDGVWLGIEPDGYTHS